MPVTMLILLRHLQLALRLHAAVPELPLAEAYAHAAAADAAATPSVPAELLLAVAYVETGYDPTSTSRVENGVRCMGHYPSMRPPADLSPRTSLFCGPLQTQAYSWRHCLAMRRLSVAYTTGAREIGTWLQDRRVRGNVRRALAGYGCGNYGVATGRCNYYPQRVLFMERKIERAGAQPQVAEARTAPRS
jgi:hypothetical protein